MKVLRRHATVDFLTVGGSTMRERPADFNAARTGWGARDPLVSFVRRNLPHLQPARGQPSAVNPVILISGTSG